MSSLWPKSGLLLAAASIASLAGPLPSAVRAEQQPAFFRAVNLNGPALVIDGRQWQGGDVSSLTCDDAAFEDQAVRLSPATDEARTKMIRASRWSPAGKGRVRIADVPAGTYSVYLYVWEDNHSETFDVFLAGRRVAQEYKSGAAGHWDRLGPWALDVSDGAIELTTSGGIANLSGVEIWQGTLAATDNPLPDPATEAPQESVEAQAAVVLARHCLECHNGSDRKGGLDLTRRDRALAGGDSGAALKPDRPEESLLVKRLEAGEMPPEGRTPLAAAESKLLSQWIAQGARWAADPIDPFLYTSDRRAGYNWWSLQGVRTVEPPKTTDDQWPLNPIDRFILARLEDAKLRPSPEADRRTLIRRLSLDLLGLPPDPDEVERFVGDPDPNAYEKLVDRLLESPHYGERWARHWLDIVRFGESQGFERNKLRPNAWRYRDFVVEAFNSDLPYDDFIRMQIAGDVLRPDDPLAVVASGFLVVGPYDLTAYTTGTADMRAFAREEELEGLVAAVCQTFLGLTVNCSRCHDHKFDPITQKEFYQISAALGGTNQGEERESLSAAGKPATQERIESIRGEMAAFPDGDPKRSRLESVIRLLEGGPAHVPAPNQPGAWRVLARGDFRQPGEIVSPRGIAAVSGLSADWNLAADAPEADRRQALAQWIADPQNPLTPRVIVNRLWGYHFGAGLVPTPSDFGFQGGMPSHPELLDWLAGQFVHPAEGQAWSLKRIQRLIVTSATYRQASGWRDRELGVGVQQSADGKNANTNGDSKILNPEPRTLNPSMLDADNRLHWRHTRQRLDAETFRDAVLAVSGELDRRLGGPGYRDWTVSSAGNNERYTVIDAVGPEFNRRTLYRTWLRGGTSPLLDVFDCPDPSVATPRRSVTTTPLQALAQLNDKFVEHGAERFAERLKREAADDGAAQIRHAYALAFSRQPSPEESEFARNFVAERGLAQFCMVLLNTSEFLYID